MIKTARNNEHIHACWEVLLALRPHLKQETFIATVRRQMDEGYHLIYIEKEGKAVSAAGFRYLRMLYCGHIIYIDDLSTLPEARGKGHAGLLLDFIIDKARAEGLDGVHLDSGHQRFDAHRLYLNKGFRITSHHFSRMF